MYTFIAIGDHLVYVPIRLLMEILRTASGRFVYCLSNISSLGASTMNVLSLQLVFTVSWLVLSYLRTILINCLSMQVSGS